MTNSSDVSSILAGVLGDVRDLPTKDMTVSMESHALMERKHRRVGKLVEQPKDITKKIVSPSILDKLNRLYKLTAHKDGLLTNCSVSLSVAQEIFTMLPEEHAKEVNKCTKNPSQNNYSNILHLVDSHIQSTRNDLNILAVSTKEIMREKIFAIRDNYLVDRLYTVLESLYCINKASINRITTGDHIVCSTDKKFIKVVETPLSAMDTVSASAEPFIEYTWKLRTLSWNLLNRSEHSLLTFIIISSQLVDGIGSNSNNRFEPETLNGALTIKSLAEAISNIGINSASLTDKVNELIVSIDGMYIDINDTTKKLEMYLTTCDEIMPFLDLILELNQSNEMQGNINDLSEMLQTVI